MGCRSESVARIVWRRYDLKLRRPGQRCRLLSPCAEPPLVLEAMGSKNERFPFGDIEQTVDMTRSRSVEFLIRQLEVKDYRVSWYSRHGSAEFEVEKQRIDMATVPKASGRYNTRSAAAKRKRS